MQVQSNGFRYVRVADDYKWQRLYPSPQTSCTKFGQNDSVSLTSFGDFNTSSESGYMWNLWRRFRVLPADGRALHLHDLLLITLA